MFRQVLSLLVVAGVGLGACRSSEPRLCPEGMSLDHKQSKPGQFVWCGDQANKTAQYIEYYPGGKEKRRVCNYLDGRPEGPFFAWFPGGKEWITGQYAAGSPDGNWSQRGEAGQRVAEGEYRRGRFVAGAPVAGTAGCEKLRP